MNTVSRYRCLIDRYWLISFVRQSESKSVTFKELLEWAPPLSRTALCRDLSFIVGKKYLLKEKKEGIHSIYSFNKRFEEKFKRIDAVISEWLAFSTLHRSKVWNDQPVLEETTPRKFRHYLSGLARDRDAVKQFFVEFQKIGIEL
ncbi:MAG: hypothetical protein JRN15_14000 [Nitrososphaerota archaeon]|nr:hypothetical protein [Nitrososphaerota archaeon]